ncbi:MAG: hypothetical protein JSV05_03615 [Candidatus Bathyarchaeota archaeon]|nr:MAG: hypothetical protein JSV05_03615 [Candidatus Bathyarchaeota archaeon]
MSRKTVTAIFLFTSFMVSYYFLLTVALPSTLTNSLDWLAEGTFAAYRVEDSGNNGPIRTGIYNWTVIDLQLTTVTLNETFTGATLWDRVTTIPPSGRLVTVGIHDGNADGLVLWLKRFYLPIFLDRTLICSSSYTYGGIEERSFTYRSQRRDSTHWFPLPYSWQHAYYDQATGLLSHYTWTWIRLGTITVSLQSTNVPILTAPNPSATPRTILEAFMLSPFVILPVLSTILGLRVLKSRHLTFRPRFWAAFMFINGPILALITNWPVTTSLLDLHSSIYWYPGTAFFIILCLNTLLWIGILLAATLLIHYFAIPLITKS